jgi:polysaccharide chain length determinant protein (PEP-CTERM system associated)
MDDIVRQVLGIVRGMWKFRWPALIVAWVVALAGTSYVLRIPDQYQASARIYVDTQSILKPLMAGLTVQPNVEQQINMLSRTLMSRPNLEKLVRMADLDLKANTPAEQDKLIDDLAKSVGIRNTGRDNLYTLNYRDEDQEKAKRVIQSLVSIFVESSLGATRKDTDSAKTFLNEQIKQYEARLEEAEARVKEFRLRNIESQSVEGRDAASRVGQATSQYQQAQLQLREAENARNAAKAQLEAERGQSMAFPTENLLSEPSIVVSTPEIDARIAQYKQTLDGLRQRYTDQHPDVVSTLRLISDLEVSKEREMAERRKLALAAAKAPGQTRSTSLAAQ